MHRSTTTATTTAAAAPCFLACRFWIFYEIGDKNEIDCLIKKDKNKIVSEVTAECRLTDWSDELSISTFCSHRPTTSARQVFYKCHSELFDDDKIIIIMRTPYERVRVVHFWRWMWLRQLLPMSQVCVCVVRECDVGFEAQTVWPQRSIIIASFLLLRVFFHGGFNVQL